MSTCANPVRHAPAVHGLDAHHHPPKAWRALLPAQPWWEIVALCPNCHRDYHDLLDAHVRAGGVPPASTTKGYSRYVRALVAQAWADRPAGRPPYTLGVSAVG